MENAQVVVFCTYLSVWLILGCIVEIMCTRLAAFERLERLEIVSQPLTLAWSLIRRGTMMRILWT